MAQPDTLQGLPVKETEGTAPEIDPKDIVITREVVETIAQKYDPNLIVDNFTSELGSKIGDNYMAIMYLVNVNVSKKNDPTYKKSHSMMLKTMPLHPARQMMVNESGAFVKEGLMYGTIFPGFEQFQKDCGFTKEEIYKDYPLCYAAFIDGKADYLALENLRTSGYQMADRKKGLDRDHVNLVMKSLAKFHALSYVKFQGDYAKISEAYPNLKERMFLPFDEASDMTKMFIPATFANAKSLLERCGYLEEATILDNPEFEAESSLTKMAKLVGLPVKNAIIGHGDCWTNNMLFKYDPITKKPIAIKLIDFQISRPCSRTIDLLYFLIVCVHDDLVNDCEDEFLQVYYNEFATFAKKLGYLPNDMTFEQLKAEYNEFRFYGIVTSVLTLQFFYANSEDVQDMETMDFKEEMTVEDAKDWLGTMGNAVIAKKLANILNVHLPKCTNK